MGRKYTVTGGQSVAASATETQVVITGAANVAVRINRVEIHQDTHDLSEQYRAVLDRITTQNGTPGGSTPTPAKASPNDAAASFAARTGQTTEPTTYAGTPLMDRSFNSLAGLEHVFEPDECIVEPGTTGPDSIIGLYIVSPTGQTTFTPRCTLYCEEIP